MAFFLVERFFSPLTEKSREKVLIVDDSAFSRERSRKVELLVKTYDHAKNRYSKGFRLLTMGWSDGNSFVPVDYALLSAGKDDNLIQGARASEGMSDDQVAAREKSRSKATKVVLDMLDEVDGTSIATKNTVNCREDGLSYTYRKSFRF